MNSFRSILAWLILLGTVGYHVWQWGDPLEMQPQTGERTLSIEERMLLFQTRAVLGSKDVLGGYLLTSSQTVAQTAWQSYRQGVTQITGQIFKNALQELDKPGNRTLLRDKIVLALRLQDQSRLDSFTQALSTVSKSDYEKTFDQVFLKIVNRQKTELDTSLSSEEGELLNDELLDYAQFLHVKLDGKALELAPEIRSEVQEKARDLFIGAIVFVGLLCLSCVFFAFYSWLFLTGRTKFLYKKSGLVKYLPMETFAFYMLAMTFAPELLKYLIGKGLITNILVANVVFIMATLIILLWPMLWGQPLFTMRQAYGMYFGSFKSFIKNILIAPSFYLGCWVIFVSALILYGLLLENLHVEVEKGAHPIVPLLLSSKDSRTPLLIALLATVVAPLIEEIMFRGALYSGLRNYLSAPFAILISALIFASIHPQGAIGMVPLTFIGVFLAFLREWRGSLVAPMIAHACVNGGTLIMVTLLMK